MKKILLTGGWLFLAITCTLLSKAAPLRLAALTTTVTASDSSVPVLNRRQLVTLKKEVRNRLRQLDVLYNKPFYTKEFIYTIDTRDMALLRTRAFFMNLFEKHPEAHDTNMLLQHLGMLSVRARHHPEKGG